MTSLDEDEAMIDFGNEVADILTDVLQDSKVNFTDPKAKPPKPKDANDATTAKPIDSLPSSTKLFIIHALWKCARAILSYEALIKANDKLLATLVSLERSVVDDARHEWASFCVDVLLCNLDAMETFWEHRGDGLQKKSVALLWKLFVGNWRTHADATWEGSVFLLGVPFAYVVLLAFFSLSDAWLAMQHHGNSTTIVATNGRNCCALRLTKAWTSEQTPQPFLITLQKRFRKTTAQPRHRTPASLTCC
jgi:hypothetical protein